ncbi:ABC transporter permease [Natronomonas sp. LN261]|uniref:ABC transporter permease n=1 Tax=Natronomonas sp. LN261 TaxID=2750669 RepID=UPI00351A6BF0
MSTPTESPETSGETAEPTEPARGPTGPGMLFAIVRRELSTAVVTWTSLGLWIGVLGTLLAITWFGGGVQVGYVSTIIDLLTPLELLIPVIAFVIGYRAILGDERRGVLDVLRTYPVKPWQVVLGTYAGRAIGLVAIVTTALSFLMFPIVVTESYRPIFYATHTGSNSPGLFLRFIVLTACFAMVVLAIAIAISALAGTTRTAITVAGLALFALLFGADIGLVFALSRGLIAESSLVASLAISPLSAYRGLVLETTVAVTAGTGPRTASPLASAVGLLVWWVGSLAIATVAVDR